MLEMQTNCIHILPYVCILYPGVYICAPYNHSRRPPSIHFSSFHRSWAAGYGYGDSIFFYRMQDYSHGCGSHGCSLSHRWAASLYPSIVLVLHVPREKCCSCWLNTNAYIDGVAGKAVKYGMCQAQCMEIQSNCDAWCKRIGYPKGGECIEPRNIDCCCWLIPPADKLNGTASLFHNRTLRVWLCCWLPIKWLR